MIQKLSIKIILAALALLLVFLWMLIPGESTESNVSNNATNDGAALVSAIKPISGANADSGANASRLGIVSGQINFRDADRKINSLSNSGLASLTRRFDEANAEIDRGNTEAGLKGFEGLIKDYPSVIEPYLNSASIYAEQQDLETARAILLQGFTANPKAGMLFDHLRKVHGALAAKSYRQALDTNSSELPEPSLVLARASNILTQLDQRNQIATLQKKLQNQLAEPGNQLQAEEVVALESRLNDLEASQVNAKSQYEFELSSLKQQIADQSQALSLSQTSEREALARVVRAERDAANEIAQITQQLESQKVLALSAQTLVDEQAILLARAQQQAQTLAMIEAENTRLTEANTATLVSPSNDPQVISSDSLKQQNLQRNAILLVQSWARAWSQQDVSAFVSHYANNYSSSQSLSRAQWLEQRQVRLSNKEFIRVEVSDFQVEDMGSQFSVIFSQYYQSNSVNDRITKRLLFNYQGENGSQSKIVAERLVSS
jgi:colicin import membrane protein